MSLFTSPLSFSSPSHKPLARPPPLSRDFFLEYFSFSLPSRSSLSLFFYSLSFDFSPSFCPCLPNAITCGCYRAENTTTDQLCPEDVEREELTIRQFKSTVPIPTVTPITIFHITHGRKNKGSYTATLDYEINLRPRYARTRQKHLLLRKINLPLLLSGLQKITQSDYIKYVKKKSICGTRSNYCN